MIGIGDGRISTIFLAFWYDTGVSRTDAGTDRTVYQYRVTYIYECRRNKISSEIWFHLNWTSMECCITTWNWVAHGASFIFALLFLLSPERQSPDLKITHDGLSRSRTENAAVHSGRQTPSNC